MRLDRYLFEHGLAKSRTEAARLIESGAVTVLGTKRTKPSFPIEDDLSSESIAVASPMSPFVSRGGEKLEGAIGAFSLSPAGCIAIDVGASTGGFTDCLLRHGAEKVYAVDAGRGQLAKALLDDPRVLLFEQYNARYLKREDFVPAPTFAVMDVSFISATLIIPALSSILDEGAHFICLIKPQFEVGRSGLGKGGIVKDDALRRKAVLRVVSVASDFGFSHIGTIDSPIEGGDGNREFLAAFRKEKI